MANNMKNTTLFTNSNKVAVGAERGIRTPGWLPINGFQDRRYRPLSHLCKKYSICHASGFGSGYKIRKPQAERFDAIAPKASNRCSVATLLTSPPLSSYSSRSETAAVGMPVSSLSLDYFITARRTLSTVCAERARRKRGK